MPARWAWVAWVLVALTVACAALGVAIPISIGVAVLRYRLYEIDRIISRTLVYATVVAVLVACYAAIVVGLQALLAPVTARSDLVVAASTLAVAALFGPLRRRVQEAVDRRFNRARYDAGRTVEGFAQWLRDEVDLDVLAVEVREVAGRTLHPGYAQICFVGGDRP